MIVWVLKLLILFLNILNSHKALRPAPASARQDRSKPRAGQDAEGTRPKRASSAEKVRRTRIKEGTIDWVIWVCFCLTEKLADRLMSWIPFYSVSKACALVMLILWRGAGSQIMYDKLVRPTVKPWEGTLDLVGFVLGEVLDIALVVLLFAPRWVLEKWRRRSAEPDVPAILRGLRQPHQPRLARTLATSIERAHDEAERINAQLSQPVTLRLNPVRPSHLRRLSHSATVLAPHAQHLTLRQDVSPPLPPPAFTPAPFRPVTVVPANHPARASGPTAPPPFQPVASTSRFPISSNLSSAPPSSAPGGALPSIYPSLAGVASSATSSSDLASFTLKPAPSTSSLRNLVNGTAVATSAATKPVLRQRAVKPRAEPSCSAEAEAEAPHPPIRRRPLRKYTEKAPQESVAEPPPPHRSPTPPPPPAAEPAPATPAPPGAFNFLSPTSVPLPDSPGTFGQHSSTADVELNAGDDEQPTPRRSSRANLKRTLTAIDTDESAAETPKKRGKAAASPSSQPTTASAPAPIKPATTATARQRALGAIAQLSHDLMDGEDGGEQGLLGSAKKPKIGVLARTSSARDKGKGKAVSAPAAATRGKSRAKKGQGEGEEYTDDAPAVSPKKRKASRASTLEVEVEEPKEEDTASTSRGLKSTAASRSRLASSTRRRELASSSASTAPSAKTLSRPRSTRILAVPDHSSTTSLARSRSRAAVSSSLGAPSPAPSDTDDTELVRPARSVGGTAPARKARRVLLGRQHGTAEAEDEEQIEGVAVTARRKRAARG
ncbi:hypothetical protein JCM21900_003162 [Sporobolomyces salmonicolor]